MAATAAVLRASKSMPEPADAHGSAPPVQGLGSLMCSRPAWRLACARTMQLHPNLPPATLATRRDALAWVGFRESAAISPLAPLPPPMLSPPSSAASPTSGWCTAISPPLAALPPAPDSPESGAAADRLAGEGQQLQAMLVFGTPAPPDVTPRQPPAPASSQGSLAQGDTWRYVGWRERA